MHRIWIDEWVEFELDSLCVLSHLAPVAKDATRIAGALLAR